MKFSNFKDNKESTGLLFWQTSMLWQRKIKQALQPYNLTHTQFVILCVIEELCEQNVCVTQKDISDFSMIDTMTVSSTVRLLENKNLITRNTNVKDTRAKSIFNTEKGKNILKLAIKEVEKIDLQFFFDEDSQNILFHNYLSKLLNKNI